MVDFNARYYSGFLGRFISPDTLIPDPENVLDWDRYLFVRGNPLRYIDPDGHDPKGPGYCYNPTDPACGGNSPFRPSDEPQNQPPEMPVFYDPNHEVISCPVDPFWIEKPKTTIRSSPKTQTTIRASTKPNIEDESKGTAYIFPGASMSASAPAIYGIGGVEVVRLPDGTFQAYDYVGEGNSVGVGGSGSVYVGAIYNVSNPEDYEGLTSSVNITVATPEGGVAVSYFWSSNDPPFIPGTVQGLTVGFAVGAQASFSWSQTYYKRNATLYKK